MFDPVNIYYIQAHQAKGDVLLNSSFENYRAFAVIAARRRALDFMAVR